MGKRKIEMRRIENKNARQVCFSKRRQGLFKKAKDLSILCGVDIAVLTFSPAGRLFSFSNTDIDSILDRYCKENYQCCRPSTTTTSTTTTSTSSNGEGGDDFWWEKVNVEEIDKGEELQQVRKSLQDVRGKVASRIQELSSASSSLRSLVPSSSDLTTCAEAEDVKWPPISLDHLSRPCSMGDESAANAMKTIYVKVEAPPLPPLQHDGVMQVESSSLDFAKDYDHGLMMPISGGEDYDDGLMKSISEEKDDDWLMMMSMISGPSTETDFDDIFPLF
ncbi:Agamous-like MADS-box protein AGL61 [Cinnamomum micranthum f. kanehirae]|uniref:Agamous-like MADS-box protein AGL61 n=1 Tax=Cinnamomum micranthum f. kanehirae TaxID=337451 RepID=A0A443P9F3_9MAGN|nr:Agamous-like MADS-box protein AGL61 [Cinnamomum micranthum f. kanehirae]